MSVPELHPAVRDAALDINQVYQERDQLRADNTELLNRVKVAEGIANHLREDLLRVTAERDVNLKRLASLTTTLNNARNMIGDMLTLMEHDALHNVVKELGKPTTEEQDAGG